MPNINRQSLRIAVACVVTAICFSCIAIESADAGMPAFLPSGWTAENPSHEVSSSGTLTCCVRVSVRRVWLSLSVAYPWKHELSQVLRNLQSFLPGEPAALQPLWT